MKKAVHFLGSEEGVTSIEYAIMASLIAVAICLAVTALGSSVKGLYQSVASAFP